MSDQSPRATPFDRIGGEPPIKQLVERFYDLMDLEPGYRELRASLKQAFFQTADWLVNQDLPVKKLL